MTKRIIVNVIPEETRMALIEDGLLLEVAVERTESSYMVGNIYKGRVENVLPGMQAAFINIGIGKNAFLYAGDIFPHKSFQRLVAEDNLTVGAEIMIEIVKDAMGSKGPRATTHFSIPGRYVVVMPSVDYVGVSRRIESPEERARLRSLAEKIRPKGMGVIVRTVAEGHSEEELARDFQYLSKLWGALTDKAKKAKAPLLLYRDADLAVRIIRDHVRDDVDEVIVDHADTHARMLELAKFMSPDLVKKIQLHTGKTEIFTHYGIEDEWGRLADRRVELKCGGYLIIDKTEALTVIDVNTGRFIGHSNLADTVFRANMEAAAEIARQLRLRDVGGIIVADFIDMQKEGHKKAILLELEAKLKADSTKTNVLGITELGLVEMTRKKSRQTYESTLYESCPCCGGRGIVQSPETLIIGIHRQLRRLAAKKPGSSLTVQMHPKIAEKFGDAKVVGELSRELGIEIAVAPVPGLQPELYSIIESGKVLVRSEESKKVRKPSQRRAREEAVYDGQALAEPLSPEEMAPLLAENFAMEMPQEPIPTLEMRLAAMIDSLWEPLYDSDGWDAEPAAPVNATGDAEPAEPEAAAAAEKKPRRRSRSKKSYKLPADEGADTTESIPPSPEPPLAAAEEPEADADAAESKKKKSRRRRRKKKPADNGADALVPETVTTGTDAVTEIPDEAVAADGTAAEPEADADAAEPKKKKSRRRRRKKKPADNGVDGLAPELVTTGTDAATEIPDEAAAADGTAVEPDEAAQAAKPKKSRRRRRKKKKTVAEDTMPSATSEPTAQAPALTAVSEPEPEPAAPEPEPAAPAKAKRRRRKKKPLAEPPTVDSVAATADTTPAVAVEPPVEATVVAEAAVPAEKPKRGRKKKAETTAVTAAAAESRADEAAAAAQTVATVDGESAATAETKPKRRRKKPAEIQPEAAPDLTAADPATASQQNETPPAGDEPAPLPKRRRSPAKKKTAAAAGTTPPDTPTEA